MTADDRLTALLPLKDRGAFTFRWLRYADTVRFPFKVLIADGGTDEEVTRVLSDPLAFPNVRYQYVRYPYDETYAAFYAKVDDALSRIDTPFVALVDNDDFFITGGLREAVGFLADHPDYVTCGGQCAQFWIEPNGASAPPELVYGERVSWKCSLDPVSLTGATAAERLRQQPLSSMYPSFYHVQRTEELRRQFRVVRAVNFADLFLLEYILAFLSAIAGKTRQLDTLYLARQANAPAGSGITHVQDFGDLLGRMLVPSWSDDFTKFVNVTSTALAARDGLGAAEARRCIVDSYRRLVAPALLENVLGGRWVRFPGRPSMRRFRRLPRSVLEPLSGFLTGGEHLPRASAGIEDVQIERKEIHRP